MMIDKDTPVGQAVSLPTNQRLLFSPHPIFLSLRSSQIRIDEKVIRIALCQLVDEEWLQAASFERMLNISICPMPIVV